LLPFINVCCTIIFADQLESDTAEPYGGDDNEDIFMESYSDALNKELNATTLQKSFIRAPQQPSNGEEVSGHLYILCYEIC